MTLSKIVWELVIPCDSISPDGRSCVGPTDSRPHGLLHYSDGWPLRKDGEPDRRYHYPVGPADGWTDEEERKTP